VQRGFGIELFASETIRIAGQRRDVLAEGPVSLRATTPPASSVMARTEPMTSVW
jgi:hypothetical protein